MGFLSKKNWPEMFVLDGVAGRFFPTFPYPVLLKILVFLKIRVCAFSRHNSDCNCSVKINQVHKNIKVLYLQSKCAKFLSWPFNSIDGWCIKSISWQNLMPKCNFNTAYFKVASSRLFRLVAHLRILRLFMKGKFDGYVLWPLVKRFQNWIVDQSTAPDFTVL